MQQQGSFAGRRRALERSRGHTDDRAAVREARKHVAKAFRASDGVELVAAFDKPRRDGEIIVRTQRNDQIIGLILTLVRADGSRHRVDRRDRFLAKAHSGLRDVPVSDSHSVRLFTTEHHIEFRKAEHKRVVLVDQGQVELITQRLREDCAQLEAAEAGAQDDDT